MLVQEFNSLFGNEMRGIALMSDLKLALVSMGYNSELFDNVLTEYKFGPLASPAEIVDHKLLLTFSDMKQLLLGMGFNQEIIDNFIGSKKYGTVGISDLKKILITSCSDYRLPDMVPPVITITGSNPITIEVNTDYVDEGATAEDDIDGDVTNNIIVINNVIDSTVGVYTVIYEVQDTAGNVSTIERIVNVVDELPQEEEV